MCVIGYRIKDNNPRCWFSLVTYYFVGRLSPLPDAASSQADEWERFWGSLLSKGGRNCPKRLPLDLLHIQQRLATFASDIRR